MKWLIPLVALVALVPGSSAATGAGSAAYVAKVDGKSRIRVRELTGGPGRDLAAGTRIQGWSADGTEILFYRGHGKTTDVFVVRGDGSGLRKIVRVRARGFRGVSPNRAWTAAVSQCRGRLPRIQIRSVRGKRLHEFRASRGRDSGWVDLAWSPRNEEIAWTHTWPANDECRNVPIGSEIYVSSLDGRSRRLIGTGGWTERLTYSRDGLRLAAAVDCADVTCDQVLVSDRVAYELWKPNKAVVLAGPLWSSSGNKLFVVLADELQPPDYSPQNPRLVAVDVETLQARYVASLPDWGVALEAVSRDDSTLAIRVFDPEQIWLVSIADGELRRMPWPPASYAASSEAVFLP